MILWFELGLIVALGIGLGVTITWLRRKTRRPHVIDLLLGISLLIIGFGGLLAGHRLMPIYFVLAAIGFLYRAAGGVLTQFLRHGR